MSDSDQSLQPAHRWKCPSPRWLARAVVLFYLIKGIAWLGVATWVAGRWFDSH